ncbi:hypothetical protein D3C81_1884060 [compost metagenome]
MICTRPSRARSPPTTPTLAETLLRMPMTILLVVMSMYGSVRVAPAAFMPSLYQGRVRGS